MRVSFVKSAVNRKIIIDYVPVNAFNEIHDLIIVNIEKIPSVKYSDSLSVEDFLRHNQLEGYKRVASDDPIDYYHKLREGNRFYLVNLSGDFEERLKLFIAFLHSVFKEHLVHIVNDNKWEEIPFDWGPYK
ncbi:MAG: hypothetical protein HRT71_07985 [Flavobacteriales bacterium]|nr:hypothetical protein [Flavobacteriales bacterium]